MKTDGGGNPCQMALVWVYNRTNKGAEQTENT